MNKNNASKNKVEIVRPPLSRTFDMPLRDELSRVFQGDSVKLIFKGGENAEKMWVTVTQSGNMDGWEGTLDNDPATPGVSSLIEYGDTVTFHPYDVIDIDLHKRLDQIKEESKKEASDAPVNKISRPWHKNDQVVTAIIVGLLGAIATIIAAFALSYIKLCFSIKL